MKSTISNRSSISLTENNSNRHCISSWDADKSNQIQISSEGTGTPITCESSTKSSVMDCDDIGSTCRVLKYETDKGEENEIFDEYQTHSVSSGNVSKHSTASSEILREMDSIFHHLDVKSDFDDSLDNGSRGTIDATSRGEKADYQTNSPKGVAEFTAKEKCKEGNFVGDLQARDSDSEIENSFQTPTLQKMNKDSIIANCEKDRQIRSSASMSDINEYDKDINMADEENVNGTKPTMIDYKHIFPSQMETLNEVIPYEEKQEHFFSQMTGREVGADSQSTLSATSSITNDNSPQKAIKKSQKEIVSSLDTSHENKTEAECLNTQGGNLLALGRNKEALETFKRASISSKAELMKVKRLIQRSLYKEGRKRGSNISIRRQFPDKDYIKHLNSRMYRAASTLADILNNTGVTYEILGEYDKAIAACEDALKVYKSANRHEATGDLDLERTKKNISQMYKAKLTFSKRKNLHDYANMLLHKATVTTNHRDREHARKDAMNTLRTAFNFEQDYLGSSHPIVAETLIEIAKIHVDTGSMDAAIKEMNAVVMILRQSLGPKHPDLGRALTFLGSLYDRRNSTKKKRRNQTIIITTDKEKALKIYQEAIVALRSSLGDVHPEVAAAHNNLGAIYFSQSDYDNALGAFTAARKGYGGGKFYRNGYDGPMSLNDYASEIVYIWQNIGEVHCQRQEHRKALTAYNCAKNVITFSHTKSRRRILDSSQKSASSATRTTVSPSTTSLSSQTVYGEAHKTDKIEFNYIELMVSTLQKMAYTHTLMGEYIKSMEIYEEALGILRSHGALKQKKWETKSWKDVQLNLRYAEFEEMANILQNMGSIQESMKDFDRAMSFYLQSLNIWQVHLASDCVAVACLFKMIGFIHLQQRSFDEASVVLEKSLRILCFKGVPDDDGLVKEIQSLLMDAKRMKNSLTRRSVMY